MTVFWRTDLPYSLLLSPLLAVALATAAIAQQPSGSAEVRRREAERMAERYRFVDQADAAWDREIAREKAGDCNDGGSTYDENMCLGRAVEASRANLKTYVDAFRGIFAISFPEEWRFAGPTGTPPTANEFLKQFDRVESEWNNYKDSLCGAVFSMNKPGTIAPSASARCELQLMRSHMRELGGTLGEGFHR